MKLLSILTLVVCVALAGCSSPSSPGPVYNYFPLSVGSNWNYFDGTKTYVRTIVGDTTIKGRSYAVLLQNPKSQYAQRLPDSVWYLRKDGNNVYNLLPDTSGGFTECLFINASAGTSGSYATLTAIGSERLVTKTNYLVKQQNFRDTVDSKIYQNVILEHIRSEILHPGSISVVTEGDYYFADGVGLIDQIVYGDLTLELTGYLIK